MSVAIPSTLAPSQSMRRMRPRSAWRRHSCRPDAGPRAKKFVIDGLEGCKKSTSNWARSQACPSARRSDVARSARSGGNSGRSLQADAPARCGEPAHRRSPSRSGCRQPCEALPSREPADRWGQRKRGLAPASASVCASAAPASRSGVRLGGQAGQGVATRRDRDSVPAASATSARAGRDRRLAVGHHQEPFGCSCGARPRPHHWSKRRQRETRTFGRVVGCLAAAVQPPAPDHFRPRHLGSRHQPRPAFLR